MIRAIDLAPDTGHHYVFYPLSLLPDDIEIARMHGLPDERNDLRDKLLEHARTSSWISAADRPWIRGKIGFSNLHKLDDDNLAISYEKSVRAVGIWLAIETNLGDEKRGYRYNWPDAPSRPSWIDKDPDEWPKPPYVAPSTRLLAPQDTFDLLKIFPSYEYLIGENIDELLLTLRWEEKRGEAFPIDLIVDFGNSRTVVLILEGAKRAHGALPDELSQICRPLIFERDRQDDERGLHKAISPSSYVVDSWIVLRNPEFGYSKLIEGSEAFKPDKIAMEDHTVVETEVGFFRKKTKREIEQFTFRIPHMFSEISPAAIGPECQKYLGRLRGAAVRCALSSPKRYAWDVNPAGDAGDVYWHRVAGEGVELLSGEIMAFMPPNSGDRFYEGPSEGQLLDDLAANSPNENYEDLLRGERPAYSKSDGLVWTALSLIEHAARAINCKALKVGGALTERYIANIMVTYPPGWTQEEIDYYYRAWQYARNIFYWTRYDHRAHSTTKIQLPPRILMHLDEAVASQLPIIYSEIRHLGNDAKFWLHMYGRNRSEEQSCRVLSIDIGGGTLDTAIVEYSSIGQEHIGVSPKIIFTDSSTRAGDKLVKDVIDNCIIPWLDKRCAEGQMRVRLNRFLADKSDFGAVNRRVTFVKLILIPIVLKWLKDLSTKETLPETVSPGECGVDSEVLADFNRYVVGSNDSAPLLVESEPVDIDLDILRTTIDNWAMGIAELHARYISAFQTDLVVVTGKPSEIKSIRRILNQRLPVESDRIIFANGYYAGSWLPTGGFSTSSDKIQDAKLVTAIGAALNRAFECDLLPNWSVSPVARLDEPLPNWWYRLNDDGNVLGSAILTPVDDRCQIEINTNQIIGRMRFPGSEPERVYIFRRKSDEVGPGRWTIELQRTTKSDDGSSLLSEKLELISVARPSNSASKALQTESVDDFVLELNTLGGNYWLDEPEFEISGGDY